MAKRNGDQPVHKPGPLKQSNKAHKHGRHRTKSQLDNAHRGRVSVKNLSKKTKVLSRIDKRRQAMQKRKSKLDAILEKKRNIGKGETPPHVVVIVSLHPSCNPEEAIHLFSKSDDTISRFDNEYSTTLISTKHNQRFTILVPKPDDLVSILDAAKLADTILFLSATEGRLSVFTENLLTCLLAQSLPSTAYAIQNLKSIPDRKKADTKKSIVKSLETWFPDAKQYPLDSAMEAALLLRHIANQKQRTVFYREHRPFLLADKFEFVTTADESEDKSIGTLKISGFVRGQPLDVNRLVHIPGFGDFQMQQIEAPPDPYSIKNIKRKKPKAENMAVDDDMSEMEEDVKLIAKANPSLQTSLDTEVVPDPMAGEQPLLDDDIALAQEERQSAVGSSASAEKGIGKKKVPKGTSNYQAAWIVDSGDEEGDSEDDDYDSDDEDNEKMMDSEDESEREDNGDEEFDTISISTNIPDAKYDQEMDIEEEKRQLEKYRAERENEMFPDEIDTPLHIPARVRFQRYRGLKSFRTSPWDTKENLPYDYSRIVQFQNFTRMKKRVMNGEDVEGAMPGWYVTVYVSNVPKIFTEREQGTLVLHGLLPHEHKMTVMHYVIKKHPSFAEPIKAKDTLIFHAGYRKFSNCPIFSQHTNGNKFKAERFLPKDGVTVATVFAPVMFPPAPVLVFTVDHRLVATGTVYKANPDRVIVKKIMLSGHPFKINKRSVVVRHMFFNRDDILWFKPVELHTKYGRHGHIKEPLGTHGHMKCILDGQVKAQDTICMSLYKRVFPKWCYEANLSVSRNDSRQDQNTIDEDDISMV